MNPFLRVFIVLLTAWLIGLLLVVGSMIRERKVWDILTHPEPAERMRWPSRVAHYVGSSMARTVIGLVFVSIVAAIVASLLPPPATVTSNTSRIEAIEKWMMAHDSLHRNIP